MTDTSSRKPRTVAGFATGRDPFRQPVNRERWRVAANRELLEVISLCLRGQHVDAEAHARALSAVDVALRWGGDPWMDFGTGPGVLTNQGTWPTAPDTAVLFWLLAAAAIVAPGRSIPVAPGQRNAVAGRMQRALDRLQAINPPLAEHLDIKPGKGPGLHLQQCGPLVYGKLVTSGHAIEVRANGKPVQTMFRACFAGVELDAQRALAI